MKKSLLLSTLLLAAVGSAVAQTPLPAPIIVQDSITGNVHWVPTQQYLLKGYVYVVNGATLTIDSGVNIKGDKATKGSLIVERGGKIFANGTKNFPIVFTSNEPAGGRNYGDWGGLILCGKAPTNWTSQDKQVEGGPRSLYGGTDPNDNSGRLSYVRIEFGGIAFSANNEVNSLSLYGVGSGTQIDHVQASFSGDDAFEWFAGSVNAKHLVAYKTVDDDFDNDNNYSGKNQFLVALREPYVTDISGSKSMESDAYLTGTYSGLPYVAAQANTSVYSNVTLVGPITSPGSTNYNTIQNTAGIHIRRGSGMSVLNSVILGFPVGVLFDESSAVYGPTTANIANGSLQFRNNIIANMGTTTANNKEVFYVKDGARSLTPTSTMADTVSGNPFNPAAGPYSFLYTSAFGNKVYTDNTGVGLTSPFNQGNPDFRPTATSPITTGAVTPNFTTSKASDPFFTQVNYVGAFGTDNWMDKWTEFDPINENYNVMRIPQPDAIKEVSPVNFMTVYPNPANNAASVMFDLKAGSTLSIGMYDITGKLVKSIFTGEKTSGSHAFTVDLSNVQPGFYTVRMATAVGSKTVSLVVAQ